MATQATETSAVHTPGPWVADISERWSADTHVRVPSLAGQPGYGPHGPAVARVLRYIRNRDEVLANARLIAAAPELLAELDCRVGDLVMLRKAIEANDPKVELLVRIDDMLRETRAAIAKAQGA
jgi:hypothetical protein